MFWNIISNLKSLCGLKRNNEKEMTNISQSHNQKQAQFQNKILICIEGNISSGKSTTVNELREYFKNEKRVVFLLEPLSIWESIRDKQGNNMITKFYGNIKQYAFAFQMMAYISRLNILRETLSNPEVRVIITERSLFTDKNVFAQMLYDDDMLEDVEHEIYMKWFDSFISDIPKSKIFYIRTTPDIAMERLISRNREGENVSLEYLERVHKYHDDWLLELSETTTLDGNVDIDNIERPYKHISVVVNDLLKTFV